MSRGDVAAGGARACAVLAVLVLAAPAGVRARSPATISSPASHLAWHRETIGGYSTNVGALEKAQRVGCHKSAKSPRIHGFKSIKILIIPIWFGFSASLLIRSLGTLDQGLTRPQ
jgi:hypothetical protein